MSEIESDGKGKGNLKATIFETHSGGSVQQLTAFLTKRKRARWYNFGDGPILLNDERGR